MYMSGIEIIPGGPTLPLPLIEALEAERLIFFCGAGISIGTGLPDFRRLTLEAIDKLDGAPNECPTDPTLRDTFCITQQYDKALDILERKISGNGLRDFVAERLTAMPTRNPDLPLHKAILTLARRTPAPDGALRGYRLVTTNYDDRFERAGLEPRWIEAAPHLARPRATSDRPGYATFLHGRIETEANADKRDPACRELILTSADFGNAYMRDGFAARFVLELFREFTVLFIGYSIDDPVMRYLVDIFATERADDRRGQFNDAYAIAAFTGDMEEHEHARWKAKNVEPILYDRADNHQHLTNLMVAWAKLHSSGVDGRFSRFLEITQKPYRPGSDEDDLTTAAWTLAEKHCRTAQRLADLVPPPTDGEMNQVENAATARPQDAHISWLGPLLQTEVIDPRDDRRPRKTCRLFEIPDIARHLCRWAMRHLDSQDLVEWAINNQDLLLSALRAPFFDAMIRSSHDKPRPPPVTVPYSTFWMALIEIAVRHNATRDWRSLFHPRTPEPSTPEALMRFIQEAEIQIAWPTKPWHLPDGPSAEARNLWDLGRFEFAGFGCRGIPMSYEDLFADHTNRERARDDLAPYLDDLTSLLLTICRLGRMIEVPFAMGRSIDERPSMLRSEGYSLEHAELSWLLEAMVLSFVRAAANEEDEAVAIALRWRHLWRREGFSLFGRLYLHAATALPQHVKADRLVDDLVDPVEVLWSGEYRAEVLPVLRLRVVQASGERQKALVERLQEPPPAGMFREGLDEVVERFRGQRLAWLKLGGVALDETALALAEAYLAENQPSEDLRADEVVDIRYNVRVGAIGFGPSLVGQPIDVILDSLRAERDVQGWPVDRWNRAGRVSEWLGEESHRVVEALNTFACEPSPPEGALDGIFRALGSLKTEQLDPDRVSAAIDLILAHADRLIKPNVLAFADLVQSLGGSTAAPIDESRFLALLDAGLAQTDSDSPSAIVDLSERGQTLTHAINAPGGKLTDGLLRWLWAGKRLGGSGIPESFAERLARLVDGCGKLHLHARIVCMQSLDTLFALDSAWTGVHLLPRLAWHGTFADQASWHWQAHLRYGRTNLDLADAYRGDFLAALAVFNEQDSDAFRAACQSFAALGAIYELFTKQEIREAFRNMGPQGAPVVINTLRRRLFESETPASIWRELIGRWLEQHWPHQARFGTERVVTAVVELIIEADDAFPEALDWAKKRGLIRPLADRYGVLWRLTDDEHKAERRKTLAERFPAELCAFLSQILNDVPLQSHEQQKLAALVETIEENLDANKEPPVSFHQLQQMLAG